MNKKDIIFSNEAQEKMLNGVNILAEAVTSTLGPKGRNVVIEKEYGAPTITKDGVSVAKEINLVDKFENMGAQMVKEVAQKTVESAGDGTTTATALAKSIISKGFDAVKNGANPMDIKRGIDNATTIVIEQLKQKALPVKDDDIVKIATISANGDTDMGKLVANAVDSVGKDGIITVEQHNGIDTTVDVVKGMELETGYLSAYFVTNEEKASVEMKNPLILITEKSIDNLKQIQNVLEYAINSQKEIIIVTESLGQPALAGLVVNKMRGALKSCAIKSPAFGEHRKGILEDLAIITGATIISDESGISLDNITPDMLGSNIESVTITKEKTTFVNSSTDKALIEKRADLIRNQISATTSDYEKEKLEKRLSRLVGGVAVIKVGGSSELEVKEKKDRIDDAIAATKSAIEEGYVQGGGSALFLAGRSIDETSEENDGKRLGMLIVKETTEYPMKLIVKNAGIDDIAIVEQMKQHLIDNTIDHVGYNAVSETFENMIEAGIIDPLKVVRSAMQNAASVAGLMITANVMIGIIPEDKNEMEMM